MIKIGKLGFAGFYNGGLGVTGGKGGEVIESSNWVTLYDALKASPSTTPQIYRYTGSNVTIADNSQTVTGKKNKTLECSAGQLIDGGELRFQDCENIIIRNIKRKGPNSTYTSRGSRLDYFTVRGTIGVVVDHCEGDGENVFNEENGVDGWMDVADGTDFLTVSNCRMWGVNRGHLLGNTPATEFAQNINRMNITFAYNWYQNVSNRAPQARWGKLHLLNNYHTWEPLYRNLSTGITVGGLGYPSPSYVITLRYYCQLYSQGNFYHNGGRLLTDQAAEFGDTLLESGAVSDGDIVTVNGYQNSNPPNHYNNVNVRTNKVLWNPNTLIGYSFDLMDATTARDYVIANAGANLTLGSYTLNTSVSGGNGTISLTGNSTWTNGDEITLTATPNTGYTVQWRLNNSTGTILSTSNSFRFDMPSSNYTIVAVFVTGSEPIPPTGRKFFARKKNEPIV
jgi:pectate lyase